jgi:hypothetical protein
MAKSYKFFKRDKNRFKKIYNYIRKKPVFEFVSDGDFKLLVGKVTFNNQNQVTYVYPTGPTSISYSTVPVVTAISHDSAANGAADVNIFISSITRTQVVFESSAPFTGEVHFQIISQD